MAWYKRYQMNEMIANYFYCECGCGCWGAGGCAGAGGSAGVGACVRGCVRGCARACTAYIGSWVETSEAEPPCRRNWDDFFFFLGGGGGGGGGDFDINHLPRPSNAYSFADWLAARGNGPSDIVDIGKWSHCTYPCLSSPNYNPLIQRVRR